MLLMWSQLPWLLLDRGLVPDPLVRVGIRNRLADTLKREDHDDPIERGRRRDELIAELRKSPIALATDTANEQHYELPTEFFRMVLGEHLKYSSAWWGPGIDDLDQAEKSMLDLTFRRADLVDGQRILELGCGWGSLTLWMAERLPSSSIVAVSNSATQREHILGEAARRGLSNVTVETADINDFAPEGTFDRIVSVEMFEHVRNYERLFARLGSWLHDDGKLFVHIFCHRRSAYPYGREGRDDWMAEHFFAGGMMPSASLLLAFAALDSERPFGLESQWLVNGQHYQRTSDAWLANMDRHRKALEPIFADVYGSDHRRWWTYWRLFFMACAELFGYREGEEWMVAHYRFARR
ncbi:MAG: cyclopropane-fatty-acyl-phospholipid synthase family protein [Acidobacteriota bacterium]